MHSIKLLMQLANRKWYEPDCNCSYEVCYEVTASCTLMEHAKTAIIFTGLPQKNQDICVVIVSDIVLSGNNYTKAWMLLKEPLY